MPHLNTGPGEYDLTASALIFRELDGRLHLLVHRHRKLGLLMQPGGHVERTEDPWAAVCEASERVFDHFARDPELARRRYEIVRQVPVLRDREIVTVFRYERLFDEYLRDALPGLAPIDAVGFSALVTAVHNHVLRQLLRGRKVPLSTLRTALDDVRRRYGVLPGGSDAAPDDVVVAVFPRSMPIAEISRRVQAELS